MRVARINFLRTLPPRDSDPILPGNRTSDPTLAAFVEVTVEPIRLRTILPASIFGGSNVLTAGAQAIAGFDQVVCDFTPIFVCNPFETGGMTYRQATEALVNASNDRGGATQTHPAYRNSGKDRSARSRGFRICHADDGFFASAFLRPHCGRWHRPGHSRIATANLPAFERQLTSSRLTIRWPWMDSTHGSIFTRMTLKSCKANYVPDANVRKGYTTLGNVNWCNAKPSGANWPIADAHAAAFPLDQNMMVASEDGDQTQVVAKTIAVGNGIWDCIGYWSVAHFAGPGSDLPPPGCTSTATISRYSVYQYEMNYISDRSPGAEIGAPQCNPLGIKNRRVLNAAIINCGSSPVAVTRNARDVPVAGFGRFFLTVPAAAGTGPYAEFLGLIKPTDSINHDVVQLYR